MQAKTRPWTHILIVSNVVFLVPAVVFFAIDYVWHSLLYVCIFSASMAYHRTHETRFQALDMFFAIQAFVYCIGENIMIYRSIILGYFNVLCVAFYPYMCSTCRQDRSNYTIMHFLWHMVVGVGSFVWSATAWHHNKKAVE